MLVTHVQSCEKVLPQRKHCIALAKIVETIYIREILYLVHLTLDFQIKVSQFMLMIVPGTRLSRHYLPTST
jgi:hypothetical protein